MFALDLFNTDHERRIAEGAVDQLEQRRIDDLAMKMDDLVARAKKASTAEVKAALMKEFQKCKTERDGYFKIKDKSIDETEQQKGPRPEDIPAYLRKQQGRAPLTPDQVKAPTPGTISHPDVLRKNRGNRDEIEEAFVGPVGSKALMNGNLATFMKARQSRQPVTLDVGSEQFRLTPAIMDAMAKKYNDDKAAADADPSNKDVKLIAINNYRAFGYPDMMRKFIDAVATPEPTPPAGEPGEQLPMFEKSQRLQKKKSNNEPELNSSSVRDTKLSRELTKARGAYPSASSDIEALVRQELDTGERIKQDVDAVQTANTAQDQTLTQLQKVNQQQTAQIAGLEKQLSTVAQPAQRPVGVAPAAQAMPTAQTPTTTKPADIPIASDIPEPTTPRDQEIYNKVQSLEKELKDKIDSMASWNAVAQKDPQSNNELVALRKEVDRTRKELQRQINKLTKADKEPRMARQAPQTRALPDPNVVDVDAWEIPDMGTAQELEPVAAREAVEKPTAIGQMAKNIGQGQELQQDPAYRSQVRRTQQQAAQRQKNIAQQKAGYSDDADEFGDIPDINEGAMKEIDIMRQDLERMNDRQFYNAYGISKTVFQQKYRALLKPALDEHGGGIGPKQHWQDLMQERKLSAGDPVVVTGSNEFEGKTGEIYEFSPSGTFVIVDLYNHGKHSMHLSDITYNEYADQEEADDWYDEEELDESENPKLAAIVKNIQARIPQAAVKRPEIMQRVAQMVAQADPAVPDAMATAQQLVQQYGQGAPAPAQTNVNDIKAQARSGNVMAQLPKTSAGTPTYAQQHNTFESEESSPVAGAIVRRIMMQRADLLKQYGPELVGAAVDNVADYVGDVDEIGSSDVSGWVAQVERMLKENPPEAFAEGFQDFNRVEPYAVCLAGRPVKQFDYYEDARRFHDNWKKKLYREGDKAKADKITLMPIMDEGWKSTLGGAALAGAMALGAGGAHARVMPGDDPNINRLTGKPIATQQATDPAPPVKEFPLEFSKEYLQKAADPNRFGRYMISVEKAQQLLTQMAAPSHPKVSPYSDDASTLKVYKPEQYKEAKADPTGSWIVYGGNKVMKFKTHTGAKAYAEKNGGKVASSEYYADRIQKPGVAETALNTRDPKGDYAAKRKALHDLSLNKDVDQAAVLQRRLDLDREAKAKGVAEGSLSELSTEKLAQYKTAAALDAGSSDKRGDYERANKRFSGIVKATKKQFANDVKKHKPVAETVTNVKAEMARVYNRLAPKIERHRDSFLAGQLYDELENIAELHGAEAEFKRMMTGARNRAHMDYDTNPGGFQNWFWYLPFAEEELSEEQDTSGVERAILNRIMVAHTDLLMKFGPEKVMQAVEEVAYNVGDVDEIGTSDVSAYVRQVKQILGVPEEVNEKWSQKYKSSINCANPKGFSQRAHCAGKKK